MFWQLLDVGNHKFDDVQSWSVQYDKWGASFLFLAHFERGNQ